MAISWDEIKSSLSTSPNRVEIFEQPGSGSGNTYLEAVAQNVDLIKVNGYLRLLGSGQTDFESILRFNDKFREYLGEGRYAVAYDVFGGIFAITKTGFSYFAPDSLSWEAMEISYEGFISWVATSDINGFYQTFLWEGSDELISKAGVDEGISVYPYLWARECDIETASKRIIPLEEVLSLNYQFYTEFGGAEDE
ncbi:MAG: DUF2625 domain-containing protein [Coriobacteriia bacterium]|nr:DUF2625 domain-containing protein [Coriobacteriia bacterium]